MIKKSPEGEPALAERIIAVTGATGFIGRSLVLKLLADGRRVRAIVRDATRATVVFPPTVEKVDRDLADEEGLTTALAGVQTIVHLVGIIKGRAADFAAVHRDLTARLLRAARRAGSVDLFVYISAQGANAESKNHYLRTKAEAEAVVRDAGIPFLILRPTVVLGKGDGFITPLVRVLRQAPVVPIIGSGLYPLRPVAVQDLTSLIARAVTKNVRDQLFTVAGPEEVTYAELVRMLMAVLGLCKPLIRLPLPLVNMAVRGLELAVPDPVLTSLQLDMLLRGSTGDPGPAAQTFGLELTPLREALEKAIR